jgi:hypothetical protein
MFVYSVRKGETTGLADAVCYTGRVADLDSWRSPMRVRRFAVPIVALAVAAFLAAGGFAASHRSARSMPSWNVPVKITNTSCNVTYKSVGHQYTRIVFGIFNNGTVAHGFDISTKFKSGLVKPHQEKTLVADFGRAGAYRYACVGKNSTVKKGIFTIR